MAQGSHSKKSRTPDEIIRVALGERGYDIIVGPGLIERAGELVAEVFPVANRVVIVTNPKIGRIYGRKVVDGLNTRDSTVSIIEVPAGERYKSWATANKLYGRLLELEADRQTVIVALGGGVIGDLTGFVAATFMRGLAYVQIPTTLLAQVDSSVGGKTAVNHQRAKNVIGVFHQPRRVIVDPDVLKTLDARELKTGLGEVVKYALIAGQSIMEPLRDFFFAGWDLSGLAPIISACCRYKAAIVAEDERDLGLRAVLNYGHTIGHAIEAVADYRHYNHGEAIALGMLGAANIARAKGLISEKDVAVHGELIAAAGLPLRAEGLDTAAVFSHMRHDKKRAGGSDMLVLLKGLGRPIVAPVETALIKKAIAGLSGGGK